MDIKEILETLTKLDVEQLNEMAFKNACGVELTKEITKELVKQNSALKELTSDELSAKIAWIVKYMDNTEKGNLIGLKISNIGTVEYILNGKRYKTNFILHIGDTKKDTQILRKDIETGLIHMKYGNSNHWEATKKALYQLPQVFKNSVFLQQSDKEFNYLKVAKGGIQYIIGVPKSSNHECVLISCY